MSDQKEWAEALLQIGMLTERVAELEAETAAFREAIQTVREQYPEDVFPPGGTSTDSRGAGMARLTCDNILRAAEAARKDVDDAQ